MPSSFSVFKRGKVYYVCHRITLDGRQVQKSLKTREQRDAYRRAKELVAEAERKVGSVWSSFSLRV